MEGLLSSTAILDLRQPLRLNARLRMSDGSCNLGYQLDALGVPKLLGLKGPSGDRTVWLLLLFRMKLNEAGYLTVLSSQCYVYPAGDVESGPLLRYEYERDPKTNYSVAHLHVEGTSEPLKQINELTGQSKGLGQLHFPLGGKRYRPSVEDVLEFLIAEEFVAPKEGWEEYLDFYRTEYHERQLRAAISASPEVARQALDELCDS
jgi:hypothetical protein